MCMRILKKRERYNQADSEPAILAYPPKCQCYRCLSPHLAALQLWRIQEISNKSGYLVCLSGIWYEVRRWEDRNGGGGHSTLCWRMLFCGPDYYLQTYSVNSVFLWSPKNRAWQGGVKIVGTLIVWIQFCLILETRAYLLFFDNFSLGCKHLPS